MPASIRVPARLHHGDRVALCAPAGPVPEERLRAGLAALGDRYEIRRAPHLQDKDGYLAGRDEDRLADLTAALVDDEVRAIFCARGGYGTMRILDRLDPQLLLAHPKPLVGFSDITSLHAWLRKAGIASIHGPSVTQFHEVAAEDLSSLCELLEGAIGAPIEGLASIGSRSVVEGPLVGGNLELITRMLGTPFALDLDGAVLLIEEVNERPYRIDRQVTQLLLSGGLERVAAIVIGELIGCEEKEGGVPTGDEVLRERLSGLGVPILTGLPVGHGKRNRALGLGVFVRVDGLAGRFEPLEPATR